MDYNFIKTRQEWFDYQDELNERLQNEEINWKEYKKEHDRLSIYWKNVENQPLCESEIESDDFCNSWDTIIEETKANSDKQ